jgi:hypothetical protein
MTCIHGFSSSVVNYVRYDILVSNQIINFHTLNGHEPDSDHGSLTLTLKFTMHEIPMEENYDNHRHLLFDKSRDDIF